MGKAADTLAVTGFFRSSLTNCGKNAALSSAKTSSNPEIAPQALRIPCEPLCNRLPRAAMPKATPQTGIGTL